MKSRPLALNPDTNRGVGDIAERCPYIYFAGVQAIRLAAQKDAPNVRPYIYLLCELWVLGLCFAGAAVGFFAQDYGCAGGDVEF